MTDPDSDTSDRTRRTVLKSTAAAIALGAFASPAAAEKPSWAPGPPPGKGPENAPGQQKNKGNGRNNRGKGGPSTTYTLTDPSRSLGGEVDPSTSVTGDASWRAEGDGDGGSFDDLFVMYVPVEDLPLEGVDSFTFADIESISYHTKTGHRMTPETAANFKFSMLLDNGGRLDAEPALGYDIDAPANQWNEFSTDEGSNQLAFYEYTDGKDDDPDFGAGTLPTLDTLQAGPVDWSAYGGSAQFDYRDAPVRSVGLVTYGQRPDTFVGNVDAIELRLSTGPGNSPGQTLLIDLE